MSLHPNGIIIRDGRFENVFYRAIFFVSGIDGLILKECPDYEIKRVICRGLLLVMINIVNFVASYYALYAIGETESSSSISNMPREIICLLLSLVWSLIIVNIYRLLVSATIQSDAYSNISSSIISLLVKAAFTAIVSGFIALPVTIFLLNNAIKSQLTPKEISVMSEAKDAVRQKFEDRIFINYETIIRESDRLNRIKTETAELQSTVGQLQKYQVNNEKLAPAVNRINTLLEREKTVIKTINDANAKIAELRSDVANSEDLIENTLRNKNNIWAYLSRIIYQAPFVYLYVFIIIFIIHFGPLLVRSISPRGMYSYFSDLQNILCCAKYGIARNYWSIMLVDGKKVALDHYFVPTKLSKIYKTQSK